MTGSCKLGALWRSRLKAHNSNAANPTYSRTEGWNLNVLIKKRLKKLKGMDIPTS